MHPESDTPPASKPKEAGADSSEVFQSLYRDLRALAGSMMQRQPAGHTLPPTALVHEAFIRLNRRQKDDWKSRSHFFAAGAMAMRHILVDHARGRMRDKRGGDQPRVALNEELSAIGRDSEIVGLDDALKDLERLNQRHSKILEMRIFGGMTESEIGEALEISERTVRREWFVCRAWLCDYLRPRAEI